jgi:hypothetical protein
MKGNLVRAMDRLKIDEGIRPLIRQLWKHGYKTNYSCQGESSADNLGQSTAAYISILNGTGDG